MTEEQESHLCSSTLNRSQQGRAALNGPDRKPCFKRNRARSNRPVVHWLGYTRVNMPAATGTRSQRQRQSRRQS